MKTSVELQTIARSYKEICEGQRPWNPLGNFMNDFFGNFPDRREELLRDLIEEPEDATYEMHKWAIFCAASVEYHCERYNLQCPDFEVYMLVSQNEQHVEIYRRSTGWMQERFSAGETVQLEQLDLELPLDAIYEGVL